MSYTSIVEIQLAGTATWTNGTGDEITMTLPDGITARITTAGYGDFESGSITVSDGLTITFKVADFVPVISYGTIGDAVLVKFVNNNFKNCIVLEDFCYGDFFESDGETFSMKEFYDNSSTGEYVYDKQSETFREIVDGEDPQYGVINRYTVPIQTKSEPIDAYFDTADIVFADYAVGDNQVDTWITANPSVAGLYMTFVESTDTEYKPTVTRVQLGAEQKTGKWSNEVYCGSRIIESKQLQPDSDDPKAIKYRFIADFKNSGKDDIEVQSLNILSTLKIFEKEGGENA